MQQLIKFLILSLILTSCATKVPFTVDVRQQYNFSVDKLKKIQFYTSEEIVLYKTKESGDVNVAGGKVYMRNDKSIEKVIIKRHTLCVMVDTLGSNKFFISGEYGEDRVLLFGNNSEGNYSLMAKNWSGTTGSMIYANKSYVTNNGNAILLVKMRKLNQLKGRKRTVKGRRI